MNNAQLNICSLNRNTLAVAAQKWQQVLVAKRSAKAAQHYLANIHTIRLFQAWRRQTGISYRVAETSSIFMYFYFILELRLLQGRAKDSLDARAKCAVWAAWNDRLRDTVRTQQTRAISRNALQKQSFVTWRLVVQARQTLRQRLERLARATFGRWYYLINLFFFPSLVKKERKQGQARPKTKADAIRRATIEQAARLFATGCV